MDSKFGMGGAPAPGISINPFGYPSEKCSECGSEVFVPGIIRKRIPGVAVGAGTDEVLVPIKVAVCAKCGALSPSDKEMIEEAEKQAKAADKAKSGKPSGGLIL